MRKQFNFSDLSAATLSSAQQQNIIGGLAAAAAEGEILGYCGNVDFPPFNPNEDTTSIVPTFDQSFTQKSGFTKATPAYKTPVKTVVRKAIVKVSTKLVRK